MDNNMIFAVRVNSVEEKEKLKELVKEIQAYISIIEKKRVTTSEVVKLALQQYLESLKAKLQK